jgi:hypothetical protein
MRKAAMFMIGTLLTVSPAAAQQHEHPPAPSDSVAAPQAMDMMGMMGRMMTMMAQMHRTMGGGMAPGMMGEGMMGGMMDMDCPCLPLRLRGALGLSEDQVRRIGQIEERSRKEQAEHARLAMEAQRAGMAALHAQQPNLREYEARMREAASHGVDAQLALASGSVEARAVLTAEQREKLRSAMEAMGELMGEHR